jgi:hypothetical protein
MKELKQSIWNPKKLGKKKQNYKQCLHQILQIM